jgi:hypothetical protein
VNQTIRIARFSRQKSRDAFGMPPDAENTSGWTRLNCGAGAATVRAATTKKMADGSWHKVNGHYASTIISLPSGISH